MLLDVEFRICSDGMQVRKLRAIMRTEEWQHETGPRLHRVTDQVWSEWEFVPEFKLSSYALDRVARAPEGAPC